MKSLSTVSAERLMQISVEPIIHFSLSVALEFASGCCGEVVAVCKHFRPVESREKNKAYEREEPLVAFMVSSDRECQSQVKIERKALPDRSDCIQELVVNHFQPFRR